MYSIVATIINSANGLIDTITRTFWVDSSMSVDTVAPGIPNVTYPNQRGMTVNTGLVVM